MDRSTIRSWIVVAVLLVMAFSTGDAAAVLLLAPGDCPNTCMSTSKVGASGINCLPPMCPGNQCIERQSTPVLGQYYVWCGCDDTTEPDCCIALETWEYRAEPTPHWQLVDCSCIESAGNPCGSTKECSEKADRSCSCQ